MMCIFDSLLFSLFQSFKKVFRVDKRDEITKIPMNLALITFFEEPSFVAFISCQGVEIVHVHKNSEGGFTFFRKT